MPAAAATRSPSSRPGRRCRTSGSRRGRTPSAAGWRCCAGSRTRTTPAATGRCGVVVAPVRSVLQPLVAGLGDLEPVALRAGDEIALEDAVRRLAAAAYTRVDLVEKRGEFAVRGGILDVFPPTEEHPLRVEFWGDTVEEVRWFAVADQRSLEVAEDGLWAPPCRELLLDDAVRARAAELAVEHPGLADMLDRLAEGIAVEGMESLAPVLVDGMELLLDLLPAGTHVVLCDPERVRTRAHDLVATGEEFLAASWAAAAAGGSDPARPGRRGLPEPRRGPRPRAQGAASRGGRSRRSRPTSSSTRRRTPWWCGPRRRSRTAATPSAPWTTWASGCATAGGSSWSPRATARPSAWSRCCARPASPPGLDPTLDTEPEPSVVHVTTGVARARLRARRPRPRGAHRDRPRRPARLDQGHAADAEPAPARRRPAAAARRRLRRARAARRRPLRRDGAAHRRRGDPRVPGHRVRPVQARPARRPAVRADRPARPGHPVRRRRGADAAPARRRGLGEGEGPRPQGGPGDRRRADPALQRAAGLARARVRAGHPLAARAGGRLPVRRDARPARRDRRGQGRHGAAGPDGPADLRRRRLRQDRDRGARGVQGGAGRQAGRGAGADDAAGAAAPVHVLRAVRELPGRW